MFKYSKILFIFLFWSCAIQAFGTGRNDLEKNLLTKISTEKIGSEKSWTNLLHYSKNIFNSFKSEINDKSFFLSSIGHRDPQAELITNIQVLLSSPTYPCQFPARTQWIVDRFQLSPNDFQGNCTELEKWRERLSAKSVSIIFASSYLNNPASMYGHTFLRINKELSQEGTDLLDFAASYGALSIKSQGFTYAMRGLLGGFRGGYAWSPYYVKVLQYNDVNSRDLWEYKINLDGKTLNQLINHLWEIRKTTKTYFFLNKNCSYELLSTLDAVNTDFDFSKSFRWRTIPIDTLKKMTDRKNFIKNISLRPSLSFKIFAMKKRLNKKNLKIVNQLFSGDINKGLSEIHLLDNQEKALILETAYLRLKHRYGYVQEVNPAIQTRETLLLESRSKLSTKSFESDFSTKTFIPPHLSHKSSRIAIGFGHSNQNDSFEEFSTRGSLHDLEENPQGYLESSGLTMFGLKTRYYNKSGKLTLEDLTLVDIKSIESWNNWTKPFSWHGRLALETAHDLKTSPEKSLVALFKGAGGLTSAEFSPLKIKFYAMPAAELQMAGMFTDNHRMGIGGDLGFVAQIIPTWRIQTIGFYRDFISGEKGTLTGFQFKNGISLGQKYFVRLEYKKENRNKESLFSLNRYIF
ncbi:MAG: DUF4105 domain-containing protein [Elusimicrobiota bacterium]